MSLGKNLRRLRNQKGWTQGQLSETANISLPQISKIERGESENPELATVKRICIALGVSADELIFDDDERGPSDELKMLFEAARGFDEEETKGLKLVIEALLVRHHANVARKLSA